VGNGAFDTNLFTTLDTPGALRKCAADAISTLARAGVDRTRTYCYAGDISSMFDKLPCDVVLKAVDYVLQLASHSATGYSLRPGSRSHVTLSLDDPSNDHLGSPVIGSDFLVSLSFSDIVDVCKYYCYNTCFTFGGSIFRLVLGIPQGGSMSDPLSKIYCVYCEHLWRDSMFDHSRFNAQSGLMRLCDLTDSGFAALAALVSVPLDHSSTVPLRFL
jgi:hypothetical protein